MAVLNSFSDIPSSWRRVAAHIIDECILAILCIPVFAQMIIRYETEGDVNAHWAMIAYFILVRFSYDLLSIYYYGATPGKKFLGLKVVSHDLECSNNYHQPLTFWQAMVRATGMRLTFFFSWAPYSLALTRYDRTHLLDWLAGTRVVQEIPQTTRMRVYPILTAFLVCYFSYQGILVATDQISDLEWRKPDLYVSQDLIPFQFDLNED